MTSSWAQPLHHLRRGAQVSLLTISIPCRLTLANAQQETQGGLGFVALKEGIFKIPSDDSVMNQGYKPLS